jgi:hypothetical protein
MGVFAILSLTEAIYAPNIRRLSQLKGLVLFISQSSQLLWYFQITIIAIIMSVGTMESSYNYILSK